MGKGQERGWDPVDHGTDFCPYPRNRRILRRVSRMKQGEECKALGEGPHTIELHTTVRRVTRA